MILFIVETRLGSDFKAIVCGVLSLVVLGEPFSPTGDKTVLSQSKLVCPNDVGDKIVLSRERHLDFSQRRNENSGRIIRSGSSRHD
jgi:hypothetical protein